MCFRLFTRRFVSGLLGTMVAGSASAQSPLPQDAPAPPRIDIASFASAPIVTARPVVLPLPATHFWDNGPRDDLTAHLSQIGAQGTLLAADDFFIKSGQHACVESITVCFAIADTVDGVMVKPDLTLTVYADCDGRPDDASVVLEVVDPELITATPAGPSMWSGFNLWTIEFRTDAFLAGHQRLWISPRAHADFDEALYYWVSANNGGIQGAQAQISGGAGPWQDVQECDCPGICTDFCFQINGHVCCLEKDNTPFDATGGQMSLQRFGAAIDTQRAVDNFQIGPYSAVDLCRLEAWIATNCPLEKVFVEIYENQCNMPAAKLLTIDLTDDLDGDGFADYPIATDTGADYLGCNIYHFVWPELVGYTLDPGRDYWISFVARGTGSILDKAYWMYRATSACHICITEGKVKNPFVEGLEDFTFVSEATSGAPRDFAFQVYTNEVVVKSGDNNEGGNETAPTGNSMTDGVVLAPNSINGKITRR